MFETKQKPDTCVTQPVKSTKITLENLVLKMQKCVVLNVYLKKKLL